MKRALGVAAVLGVVLSLPLIAADNTGGRGDAALTEGTPKSSSMASTLKVHRIRTVKEPYQTTDSKTGFPVTEYRDVAHAVEMEIPAHPQKIEALRQRLRELEEQRIELLSPATLMEEIEAREKDVLERRSWKRLQEVRQLLGAISAEFPETKADTCAKSALKTIPEEDEPTSPPPQPTPAGVTSSGPIPIKGL